MVRIGAIIQARLGSERLPNKALLPLPFGGGPSLLEHVVARANATENIATVIVATTEKTTDDAIYTFCQQKQLNCFRGAEDDVLGRYYNAATKYKLDIIIRLTGDNPFIMPNIIDESVQSHLEAGVDYSITDGLPLGTNIEVISFKALERAYTYAKEPADREHVTPYIRREKDFNRQSIQYDSPLSQVRLTVDYPSDYALASLLYERLYRQNPLFTHTDLELLFQQHAWLSNVNIENQQRQAFSSETEEFESATKALKLGGYTRVLQKLQEGRK